MPPTNRPHAPTTDELRDRIDAGGARDKVDAEDPAAVPLGGDAEASGNPPTSFERRIDAESQNADREAPDRSEQSNSTQVLLFYGLVVIAVAALLTIGLLLYQ